MNINIYIEDELAEQITSSAKLKGKSRNSIIREALKEWLKHHKSQQWPSSVLKFKGDTDFPRLESHRKDLRKPKEDPFS